jgi:hypothetical protein
MDSATWRTYKSPRGLEALANSVLVVRNSLILAQMQFLIIGCDLERDCFGRNKYDFKCNAMT